MLKVSNALGRKSKAEQASLGGRLEKRNCSITHCERTERWKAWKESQETQKTIPSQNCFQNKRISRMDKRA